MNGKYRDKLKIKLIQDNPSRQFLSRLISFGLCRWHHIIMSARSKWFSDASSLHCALFVMCVHSACTKISNNLHRARDHVEMKRSKDNRTSRRREFARLTISQSRSVRAASYYNWVIVCRDIPFPNSSALTLTARLQAPLTMLRANYKHGMLLCAAVAMDR